MFNYYFFSKILSRKKWIDNCGNPEIAELSDRQLRGRRLCSDHFERSAFTTSGAKETLSEKAVPMMYVPGTPVPIKRDVETITSEKIVPAAVGTVQVKKRSVGRPRKIPVVEEEHGSGNVVKSEALVGHGDNAPANVKGDQTVEVKAEGRVEVQPVLKRGPGRPKKSVVSEVVQAAKEDSLGKDNSPSVDPGPDR